MAVKVTVTIKDKSGNFVTEEKRRLIKMGLEDTERLAKRAETVIRSTIENVTAGGTGKLASADGWNAESIPGGWGIGDIEKLNSETPYWRHQNYGSEGIGANWQHFLPKGFWFNGRWVVSDTGFSGIMPKTPIPALNYIEKTLAQMSVEENKILKGK